MSIRRCIFASLGIGLAAWLGAAILAPTQLSFHGHSGQVGSVVAGPGGTTLISVAEDPSIRSRQHPDRGEFCSIKLWDVATQTERVTLKGLTRDVWSVAFSPDGKTLATGAEDMTIRLWDVRTAMEKGVLKGHTAGVSHVVFHPDGNILASASFDKTARLWDVSTGKELATLIGHGGRVAFVAFSPNGTRLATGNGMTLKLWDVPTGKEQTTLHERGEVKPFEGFRCVAFSPDGKVLAAGNYDTEVWIWDVASGQRGFVLGAWQPDDYIDEVVFSPEGKTLVALSSLADRIDLWDVASGRKMTTFDYSGQSNMLRSLWVRADGRLFALGNVGHPDYKTVKMWPVTSLGVRR
jgi:WD40 repeat protein